DVAKVLQGFLHVLKSDGFADIRVPDLQAVMQHVVESKMDIEDVLYGSPAGPITVHDVIFGFRKEIERSGHDFFAHKTGFTPKSLCLTLERAGFSRVFYAADGKGYEARALAF